MVPEGYRKMELRELQLLQLEAMKELHEKCIANGIEYYLIGGSLLGAVRHTGFIPWDDDMDIAMMRPQFERFKAMFPKMFDTEKFFLQSYETDEDFQPALMRFCIKNTYVDIESQEHHKSCKNTYIDIFPLDNVPDDATARTKQAKRLRRIDRLMNLKLYRIYPENGAIARVMKKVVSTLLGIVPLKSLQSMRQTEMMRYQQEPTHYVCSTVSRYGYFRQVMPREIYGAPVTLPFEDAQFLCPEQYLNYLRHLYGENYMQLPPENKRVKPQTVYCKIS